jgi:taurine dioxygenase
MRVNKPVALNPREQIRISPTANYWHSDFSFSRFPPTFSFLNAKELPSIGGDTQFASLHAAYDALSPAFRDAIASLDAVHDFCIGSAYAVRSPEDQAVLRANKPPVVHPLVREHSETGRKLLFVDSYIRSFVGMTEEESKPLLDFLLSHATRYEFVYRHRWSRNDLVIWDNRSALHYAVPDHPPELRMMMRCSLVEGQTLPAYETASAG